MDTKNLFSRPTIYILTLAYIVLGFLTLGWGNQIAAYLYSEDHYFENVGFLGFLATSILFFYAFLRSRDPKNSPKVFWLKQLVFLGLALLFFFGAGEEISWGQRIFNVQTPAALNAINDQHEINIHNIAFNGREIPYEFLFDVFWSTLTILLPLASLFIKPVRDFFGKFIPIVPIWLGLLFFGNYSLAKVAKAIYASGYTYDGVPFVQAVQETKESNYAVLFVLIAFFVVLELIHALPEKSKG